MHSFYAFKVMIIHPIPHFVVTMAAAAAHAHVTEVNESAVLCLPRDAPVSRAIVGLEKDALCVFLHGAFTWATAESDCRAVHANIFLLDLHFETTT